MKQSSSWEGNRRSYGKFRITEVCWAPRGSFADTLMQANKCLDVAIATVSPVSWLITLCRLSLVLAILGRMFSLLIKVASRTTTIIIIPHIIGAQLNPDRL